jgi:hypothetical protein
MAEVTMTMEEYLALVNGLSGDITQASMADGIIKPMDAPKKRKGKKNPKLKRALVEANRRMRLKSGKLRKGKTQADVMRLAHRLLKKM